MIVIPPPPEAGPVLERILVTPEIAREWEKMGRDRERPLKAVKLNNYITDMVNGNWYDNGQTVGFGPDGKRNNGNHRVWAVIRASERKPDFEGVWMSVAWNADGRGIDVGAVRSYGDHLAIEGRANSRNFAKNLATVTRFAYMWDHGARSQGGSRVPVPTHTELDKYQDTERDLLHLAAERGIAFYSRSQHLISAGTFGMAYFLIARRHTVTAAEEFLNDVAIGANLAEYSPAYQLRKTLGNSKKKRLDQSEVLAYILIAWRSHKAHRPAAKIQMPKGGLTTENYPEP